MDKLLDRVLKFFENKSISFSKRTSIFIISIFALISCDYFFDFSYDHHLNNKIEKLESINNLKKVYKSDSLKLAELSELENRIFKRTHYSDRLRNLDLNQFNIFKKSDTTEIKKRVIKNDNTITNKPIRSLFWMILSSNYVFIIVLITLIILPFTGSVHRETKNLLGAVAAIIIIIGVICFITWISYQIQLIKNNPTYNYILNFFIHTMFWLLLGMGNTKKEKK